MDPQLKNPTHHALISIHQFPALSNLYWKRMSFMMSEKATHFPKGEPYAVSSELHLISSPEVTVACSSTSRELIDVLSQIEFLSFLIHGTIGLSISHRAGRLFSEV
ncbi:hypothetical protein Ancab_026061 [Ancistrocladus abbreviatus]